MKVVNAIPGFGPDLSEQQVKNFLETSKLNLQIGTIDSKGDPNIHPVWYLFENEKLYVATPKKSKKAQNALKHNLVYYSIDDEKMPYKGVRGKGIVRISENINVNIPIAEKIMIKYTGNLDNEVAKFLMNGVRNGFSILLEITPKYFATWDHSTGFTEPEHSS